ncbi:hypothetical protein [Burkholderia cepacia]|uniref:hypothetical protein n=1 Tax=Burkholderia cepacia TaxID=292 RepID=UPI000F5ECB6E|nr:hypothetical protein [Burkholderia cepacia]
MKKCIFLAIAFSTATAFAAPPKHSHDDVLVWPTRDARAGEAVDLNSMIYTLHTHAECSLPLVNAKNMRRLDVHSGATNYVGCWGLLLGDRVVMIDPEGKQTIEPMVIFGRASVHEDGTGTLQYASYSKRQP